MTTSPRRPGKTRVDFWLTTDGELVRLEHLIRLAGLRGMRERSVYFRMALAQLERAAGIEPPALPDPKRAAPGGRPTPKRRAAKYTEE